MAHPLWKDDELANQLLNSTKPVIRRLCSRDPATNRPVGRQEPVRRVGPSPAGFPLDGSSKSERLG